MPASQNKLKRPPVVVVMGHVDHGKTTLLDYIRKSNVAAREAGGITQAVGAYEIVHNPSTHSTGSVQASSGQAERITFIDTPGHEAFTKMRSRGAQIADIAILVVAADDGVSVQTKEAIKIIQDARVPVSTVSAPRQEPDLASTRNDETTVEEVPRRDGNDAVIGESGPVPSGSGSFAQLRRYSSESKRKASVSSESLVSGSNEPRTRAEDSAHWRPLPYVVAINKIDKNNADVERTKADLMKANVLLEGYGGSVSVQPISAKTGENVNELLDLILLTAEVEELTYDPSLPGLGIILEAKIDSRSGPLVTAIVKDGVLRAGEMIQAGSVIGKIKGLKNFLGENINELTPCSPAIILGFETLPKIGDAFVTGTSVKEVSQVAKVTAASAKATAGQAGKINFVIKANVSGSLEALAEAVKKIQAPGGKSINIVSESVGDVTDGDAQLAVSTHAMLIAFKVKILAQAQTIIRTFDVKVFESEIIYELLEAITDEMTGRRRLLIAGDLEVLAVFSAKGGSSEGRDQKKNQVIGGKVIAGEIKNQATVEIVKRGAASAPAVAEAMAGKKATASQGKIVNLQQNRKDTQVVIAGLECGLLVSSDTMIAKGDHLIIRQV